MEYSSVNQQRRSVNVFDPSVKISEEEIESIFQEANLAPSSFNLQPWKIIVALTPAIKTGLKAAAFNQGKVTQASAVLVFFGNTRQYLESDDIFSDWVKKGYLEEYKVDETKQMAENLYAGDKEIGFVSRNVGLLAMNFMLSAQDRGWDTHAMDGFDIEAVKELFDLPDKYLPVMLVAIGKKLPSQKLLDRAMRRSYYDVCEVR